MRKLERLLNKTKKLPFAEIEELGQVQCHKGQSHIIWGITLGSNNPHSPTLGLFGGVHGIEKIGSHLVINHLKYLVEQIDWDNHLYDFFQSFRIASIPIVNPGGMANNSRCNPNGVDLMRNAPVELGQSKNLVSGQNYSPRLPWYTGKPLEKMEIESDTLLRFVRTKLFPSKFSMALDVHSGFGLKDRLWYPYSKTKEECPDTDKIKKIKKLFRRNMPYHNYIVEQQSTAYTIYGDLWDYLYDEARSRNPKNCFIPWTLELGSWAWVKKNIFQGLRFNGYFNPIVPHRYDRIMRRHRGLLEFFRQSAANYQNWSRLQ